MGRNGSIVVIRRKHAQLVSTSQNVIGPKIRQNGVTATQLDANDRNLEWLLLQIFAISFPH